MIVIKLLNSCMDRQSAGSYKVLATK